MSTIGHVNRPLTEQSLLTFTTCHCIRHIVIFSGSPSPFFLHSLFLDIIIIARLRSLHHLRRCYSLLQYTHPSLHTHIFIELSCESRYSTASSVTHVSPPIFSFLDASAQAMLTNANIMIDSSYDNLSPVPALLGSTSSANPNPIFDELQGREDVPVALSRILVENDSFDLCSNCCL
jgi:hypothetical protein